MIGRSNIEVTGTYVTSLSDTTLQRADKTLLVQNPDGLPSDNIMLVAPNVHYVVIEDFTFDGNRCGVSVFGPGQSCPGNPPWSCICTGTWRSSCRPPHDTTRADTYIDLETQALFEGGGTGYLTVMFVNFINAPTQSMTLATGSEVTYSNFLAPANSGVVTWVANGVSVTNAEIDRNTFQLNGGSAIALQDVQNSYVAYNQLLSNENEAPDGGASQLDIDPASSYIYVIDNTIDGQNNQNLCVGGVGLAAGIELYGSYVYLEGNTIINNPSGPVGITALAGTLGGHHVYFQPDSWGIRNTMSGNDYEGVNIWNTANSSLSTHDVYFTSTTITNNQGWGINIDYNETSYIYNIVVDAATVNSMTGNTRGKINANCGPGSYNCPPTTP